MKNSRYKVLSSQPNAAELIIKKIVSLIILESISIYLHLNIILNVIYILYIEFFFTFSFLKEYV